jgi:hypothetical protein
VTVPARLCDTAELGACQDELLWFPMEAFVVPPDFTGAPGSLGALAILATPERRLAGVALSCCAGPTGATSAWWSPWPAASASSRPGSIGP